MAAHRKLDRWRQSHARRTHAREELCDQIWLNTRRRSGRKPSKQKEIYYEKYYAMAYPTADRWPGVDGFDSPDGRWGLRYRDPQTLLGLQLARLALLAEDEASFVRQDFTRL